MKMHLVKAQTAVMMLTMHGRAVYHRIDGKQRLVIWRVALWKSKVKSSGEVQILSPSTLKGEDCNKKSATEQRLYKPMPSGKSALHLVICIGSSVAEWGLKIPVTQVRFLLDAFKGTSSNR